MNNPARERFRLTNEISPIILTDGIASSMPGGVLPIISITQGIYFPNGVLDTSSLPGNGDLDSFFAHFVPLPGATLIDNDLGRYPFANQQVAANAIIAQPLRVSLMMHCPAKAAGDYPFKLQTFMAVQKSLEEHSLQGGTYTVVTPAWVYYNCILRTLRDATGGESKQVQASWQWDFEQPLLTQAQAQEAQNAMTSKISAQTQLSGDPPRPSGLATAVGVPGTGIGASLIPAATSLGGSIVGRFGSTLLAGGPAAVAQLQDLLIGPLASPAGSAALQFLRASGVTSQVAQAAARVAGLTVIGPVNILCNRAVNAVQSAVLALAGNGPALPSAEQARSLANAVLSASQGAATAPLNAPGQAAVNGLIDSAKASVAAADLAVGALSV